MESKLKSYDSVIMERASQLSRLTQEKQNLERAAFHDKSIVIEQEKEKDILKKQQLQENLTSRIAALEKDKESLQEKLKAVSLNESKLKADISAIVSKTKLNDLSETRLMKEISDLQDKVT